LELLGAGESLSSQNDRLSLMLARAGGVPLAA
jgi:hypothetical protein